MKCSCCGYEFNEYDTTEYVEDSDLGILCEDCALDHGYKHCEDCGKLIDPLDCDSYNTNDGFICEDCKDRYRYLYCEDCDCYFRDYDLVEVYINNYNSIWVCRDCLDNGIYSGEYFYCDECGGFFYSDYFSSHDVGDKFVCEDCFNELYYNYNILEYHDFDDWQEYYKNNCNESTLKGFELEVDGCGDFRDRNNMVNDIANEVGDFCVFEHDGSLSDLGVEIISNPFTMPYLYSHESMIKNMLEIIEGYNFSEDGDCGLHIHVNRRQLSLNTDLSNEQVIDNILIIMETFKDELVEFSRRDYRKLKQWAKFLTDEKKFVKREIDDKKHGGRYHALNLTNSNTIEFRIFKSTTDFNTLMASIELVDNIVEVAKGGIDGLTWLDIINYGNTKYLVDYNNKHVSVCDDKIELESVYTTNDTLDIDTSKYPKVLYRRYGEVYKGVLLCEQEDSCLLGLDGFNGHNGDGDVPSRYKGHCWYVYRNEFEVIG